MISKKILMQLHPDILKEIDFIVAKQKRTRSDFLREAIRDAVQKVKEKRILDLPELIAS
jgi:metal-responsive CopG/Arc/MetJ family transcriptional regulator